MISLRGQNVMVVGLGKSGVAAARLLLRAGAKVTVEEVRPASELGAVADELSREGAQLALGRPLAASAFQGKSLVVVSPGVPLAQPALKEAKQGGLRVVGEVELASWFLRPQTPLVGITGTNGKSTTTALCGELLAQGGFRPFVGGNLGRPLSDAALSNEPFGAYVVELSSYQLEGLEALEVNPAALTNIAPDHLDRYPSYEDYQAAKQRIFAGAPKGIAVINLGDAVAVRLALASERLIYGFAAGFAARDEVAHAVPKNRLVARAVSEPSGGGFRVEVLSPEAHARFARDGSTVSYRVQSRALRGEHNLENAMCATLLARSLGVADERIQRGLDSFPGLPHRLELVRTLDAVEWVNDSKATNVDSAVVALRALAGQRVWLIAGGKGKGAPYAPLVTQAKGLLRGVLTLGSDAAEIARAFEGSGIPVEACQTLEKAVHEARARAQAGDTVLLSPACASFDQFRNFEDRGQTFRRLVEAL